ncbi:serine protease 58 isoform X1 [Oryctolagus cuniculus]|uniref:serine protease 58 isoform X1 n=1 Tax=Oryctolagus cuniculus TaxID=9986 RepID=UPI00223062EA|nr:serine protease 58 isoform X1 [Oryctolagus cuniculus]XP_051704318.1 serine protease 58 isoform X1 [Oryctolagus cuniculus]
MTHVFLVFTLLTVAAGASAKGNKAKQMSQMEAKTKEATFLIFLDSESELCLGTLIHEQWVLTAAHCFLPFLKIKIATSGDRRFQNLDLRPLLVVRHPNFTQDSAEHDIMLVKLESPLQLGDELKLAALPNSTDDKRGTTCTVAGWGWTWKQYNKDPDIQINQDVVWFSSEDCQAFSTRTISTAVPDTMFCAGLSLGSTFLCWEVTAAPILCQHQLQGILSWSEGCVLRGSIGYYTKISQYTDWILKVIHTK